MSGGREICGRFERALLADARRNDIDLCVDQVAGSRWASATFVGTRILLEVAAPDGPGLDAWFGALGDAEFYLPGHLVADVVIEAVTRQDGRAHASIAVLTVED